MKSPFHTSSLLTLALMAACGSSDMQPPDSGARLTFVGDGSTADGGSPGDRGDAALAGDAGQVGGQTDAGQVDQTDAGSMAEGSEPPPCRVQDDCPAPLLCRLPDYAPPVCRGIPCSSDLVWSCDGDLDCGDGPFVCQIKNDDVCGPQLYGECGQACSDDSECGGTKCQADGRCLPLSHCSLGAACPVHTTCQPSDEANLLGCTRLQCSADADCGEGHCLDGRCFAQLGTCTKPEEPCLAP